jgi:hypothetical protein
VVAAAFSAAWIGCAPEAHAGPRPYAFTQGIDTLPPDELELESWFGATAARAGGTSWEWWLGPVVGLTDHLEAGLFAIFAQGAAAHDAIVLSSLRLQLSYALADKGAWPIDVRVRGELGQPVAADEGYSLWLLAIVARDVGPVNITLNAGTWVRFDELEEGASARETVGYFVYGLAASLAVAGGLRLGGELFGEGQLGGTEHEHCVGPSAAFGRGRFWLSGSLGLGIDDESPSRRGRLVLGLAF